MRPRTAATAGVFDTTVIDRSWGATLVQPARVAGMLEVSVSRRIGKLAKWVRMPELAELEKKRHRAASRRARIA